MCKYNTNEHSKLNNNDKRGYVKPMGHVIKPAATGPLKTNTYTKVISWYMLGKVVQIGTI